MDIRYEIDNILQELNALSKAVSQKESEYNSVKSLHLSQLGTDSYELNINSQNYYLEQNTMNLLLERLEELGLVTINNNPPKKF